MLMKPYVSLRPGDQLKNVSLFCLSVEYILLYLSHPSHEWGESSHADAKNPKQGTWNQTLHLQLSHMQIFMCSLQPV